MKSFETYAKIMVFCKIPPKSFGIFEDLYLYLYMIEFIRGSGVEGPGNYRNYLKDKSKTQLKPVKFRNVHKLLADFYLNKLILIKVKWRLMEFWKSLIILISIKKPSCKSLRVWVKNQLRFEIFQKILKFISNNLKG